MLYRHATGCAWRDLPERYGPWSTVASRQRRWTREGLWDRVLAALQRELADAGRIDWACGASTAATSGRIGTPRARGENRPPERLGEPADHALGRSRGGLHTKLHLVTDGAGLPLAVALSAGQAHESRTPRACSTRCACRAARPGGPRRRPRRSPATRATATRHPRWLRRHGVRAVIPERADQVRQRAHRPGRKPQFDRAAYRRRSAIECTVGALKEAAPSPRATRSSRSTTSPSCRSA
jgi:transposase